MSHYQLPDTLSSAQKAEIVCEVIEENRETLFYAFTVIAINKKRVVKLLPKPSESQDD